MGIESFGGVDIFGAAVHIQQIPRATLIRSTHSSGLTATCRFSGAREAGSSRSLGS